MATCNVGGTDRIVRGVLAVGLTVLAALTFRSGRRVTGLLALVGAIGFGFNASTGYCGLNDALGIDTTNE